jgi:hypothetical protein
MNVYVEKTLSTNTVFVNGSRTLNALHQQFSNCGTRLTNGTRKTKWCYAKGWMVVEKKLKIQIFNSYINLKTLINLY